MCELTRGFITSLTIGCLALVFGASEAAAAPIPSFTVNGTPAGSADPIPVPAEQPVTFESTSTPSALELPIVTTAWDFDGNGDFETPGTPATPVMHTFPACTGTVAVGLQVSDNSADPTAPPLTQQIEVVDPPTLPSADFGVPLNQPLPGVPVTFTSTVAPVGECSISIEWAFDNGPFEPGAASITHAFTEPGMHTVRLRVQDSRGPSSEVVAAHGVYVNTPPVAGFDVFPDSPLVGETVTLNSTSSDVEGEPLQQWDLDGDGPDDGSGRSVRGMFTVAGNHSVSLLVTDGQGAQNTATKLINVRPSPMLQPIPGQPSSSNPTPKGNPTTTTQQPFLRLLTPFPVVRLQGSVVQRGTRIRRLTVRAPKGSRVFVYCHGRRCPTKRLSKVADRRTLRFRALERLLPPRSLLQVFVRRGERIGKYTSFLIRRKRVPKRIDGCLLPSSPRAVTCPED